MAVIPGGSFHIHLCWIARVTSGDHRKLRGHCADEFWGGAVASAMMAGCVHVHIEKGRLGTKTGEQAGNGLVCEVPSDEEAAFTEPDPDHNAMIVPIGPPRLGAGN